MDQNLTTYDNFGNYNIDHDDFYLVYWYYGDNHNFSFFIASYMFFCIGNQFSKMLGLNS